MLELAVYTPVTKQLQRKEEAVPQQFLQMSVRVEACAMTILEMGLSCLDQIVKT